MNMTKGDQNEYTAVIPSTAITTDQFAYYIEAKNQSSLTTKGTADAPITLSLEVDEAGPDTQLLNLQTNRLSKRRHLTLALP